MGFREGRLKDKFASFEAYKNPIPKRRELLAKRPFLQAKRALLKNPCKLDRVSFSTPDFWFLRRRFRKKNKLGFCRSDLILQRFAPKKSAQVARIRAKRQRFEAFHMRARTGHLSNLLYSIFVPNYALLVELLSSSSRAFLPSCSPRDTMGRRPMAVCSIAVSERWIIATLSPPPSLTTD